MNTRRVATLLRELADAIEDGDLAVDPPADEPSAPRATRRTPPSPKPRLVRPEGENDELAKRKAQRFLRQNGFTKAPR